jgi:hypothetical protein
LKILQKGFETKVFFEGKSKNNIVKGKRSLLLISICQKKHHGDFDHFVKILF